MKIGFFLPTIPQEKEQVKPSKRLRWFWLILFALILAMAATFEEFVEQKKDGSYELRTERKKKLQKELDELDEAEQYVLQAKIDGYYACYNCGEQLQIYLHAGEVWKYGHTTKQDRYPKNYLKLKNLEYFVQYRGLLVECMKEEKRKIYYYPLLPENLKRSFKLPRPPGNKQDN